MKNKMKTQQKSAKRSDGQENSTFDKVWKMFQENIEQFKETDKRIKELNEDSKELHKVVKATNKGIEELNEDSKELHKVVKATNKGIEDIKDHVDGISKSNGEIAEDFFFNGLETTMKIGEIEINFIDRNLIRFSKKLQLKGEYDILLSNDNLVVIVEVKYKVRTEDIEKLLNQKIPNFRKLFPRYSNFYIQGAIAGLTIEKKAIELGKKYGFYIITQSGENLKYLNPSGRVTNGVNDKNLKTY